VTINRQDINALRARSPNRLAFETLERTLSSIVRQFRWVGFSFALTLGGLSVASACGAGPAKEEEGDAGANGDADRRGDARTGSDGSDARRDEGGTDGAIDAADGAEGGGTETCSGDAGDGGSCYAITCTTSLHSLQDNRDRLIADLAKRKCTDACTLWAALNEAERYIFLMDTAYLGAPASLLYPPGSANKETALDHATALYTINGPKAAQGVLFNGLGGNDYNRIYCGFDALAQCVMRDFTIANPTHEAGYNEWVKSDDLAGPHAPFTQRDMIAWFKALTDLQTQGPQFHFWAKDTDFTQSGLNQRLGVCGVTDPSVTELTIAFDSVHDSNPLGKYGTDGRSMGGYGWQVVDQFVALTPDWTYMPSACPTTAPVNTSTTGGGTFAGMGPSLDGSVCTSPALDDGGACP
jgi:hypothetical protein